MDYFLRDVPVELWKVAKRRSQDYGIPLRTMLLRGLRDQLENLPAQSLPRVNLKSIKRCFAEWKDLHTWARIHDTSPPIAYALAIYSGGLEDLHWQWKNPASRQEIVELAREIAPKFEGYDSQTPLYWGKEWGKVG